MAGATGAAEGRGEAAGADEPDEHSADGAGEGHG